MELWQEFLQINSDDIKAINEFIDRIYKNLSSSFELHPRYIDSRLSPLIELMEFSERMDDYNLLTKLDPLFNNKENFKKEQQILKKILEKISKKKELSKEDIEKIDAELQNNTISSKPRYYSNEEIAFKSTTLLGYIYYQIYQILVKPDLQDKLMKCQRCGSFFIAKIKRKDRKWCSRKCGRNASYHKRAREKISQVSK